MSSRYKMYLDLDSKIPRKDLVVISFIYYLSIETFKFIVKR